MSIFVTSDLHFNHKGILNFSRECFHTIEEHNEYIISEYNKIVQKDDLVYILGDIGFTPLEDLKPLVKRLNGRKILIIGNHDQGSIGDYRAMGFIEVYDHPVYYSSSIILSHEPVLEALHNPYVYNVHGHLHKSYLCDGETSDHYINVNVELTNYQPLSLKDIQQEVSKKIKTRRETFGKEWYKKYYKAAEILSI